MAQEFSPLRQQMKNIVSGFGAKIFEHNGYGEGDYVESGSVTDASGNVIEHVQAWHSHEETGLEMDGIPVKATFLKEGEETLIRKEDINQNAQEVIDAQMRNDEY